MVNTIFIMDEHLKVTKVLTVNGQNTFFDDLYTLDLSTGSESYEFSTNVDVEESDYVMFYYHNQYKLFQITEIEQEHSKGEIITNVYGESICLELLNNVVRPFEGEYNCISFFQHVLEGTDWSIGKYSSSLAEKVLSVKVDKTTQIWAIIQDYMAEFGYELNTRVIYENGYVKYKIIDIFAEGELGEKTYKRFEYGRNVTGITKKKDLYDFCTALIIDTDQDIVDVVYDKDGYYKAQGSDVILAKNENKLYNLGRDYIYGSFEDKDCQSGIEAVEKAVEELKKRAVPRFDYECDTALTWNEFNEINIGDTVYCIDSTFNPVITLEARVGKLELSFTDRDNCKCNLTNYKEIKSKISAELTGSIQGIINSYFPITTDKLANGCVDKDKINVETYDVIIADAVGASKVVTNELIAKEVMAINGQFENLNSKYATIENLNVTNGNITTLTSNLADITTLVNGNLTSDNIQSMVITGDKFTVANGFIKNAMIESINANKINAGTINTNNVKIQSADGSMVINGATQQFKDKNNKVRIQIGKDAQGNFTFALFSQDGVGVLIDETGIKSGAVPNGLIVNNMVSDSANISGSKLDINSVISSINNGTTTIKGTRIQLDEQGQSLQVAFSQLKSKVETIEQVTIDGDLSSVIEQVTTNTTSINAMQGQISSLISNTTITKANGEVVQLKDEYNSTKSTVDSHTTKIGSFETKLATTNNNISSVSSKQTALEQNLNGFKQTVSQTYTTKADFNNLEIGGRNFLVGTKNAFTKAINTTEYTTYDPYSTYSSQTLSSLGFKVGDKITVSFDWSLSNVTTAGNFRVETVQDKAYKSLISGPHNFGSSTSGRYVGTKTLTSDDININKIRIRVDASNLTITIKNMKLEKGNKATSWSPAPEDTDSAISTVDGKFVNYSTTSQMNSAINQKSDAILSTVSSTYTTKADFNSLTLGGTNLVANSAPQSTSNWSSSTGWAVSLVDCAIAPYGKAIRATNNSGTSGAVHKAPIDHAKLINGEYYTISAWIRASKSCKINFHNEYMVNTNLINLTTSWKYYTFTSKINTGKPYHSDVFYVTTETCSTGMWLEVHSLKLEKGTKPSSWSPAPEDIDSNIAGVNGKFNNYSTTNQMNSAITQKANEIISSVSRTYATKTSVTDVSNNLKNNYSTTSAMNSAINQKANEITSSVSQTYATKSEFNGLSIGGTNLYPNSNFKTKPSYTEKAGGSRVTWDSSVDEGTVTTKYNGKVVQLFDSQGTSSNPKDVYLTFSQTVTLQPKTTYTLSFDYYSVGALTRNSSYIYLWKTKGDASTRQIIALGVTNSSKNRTRLVKTFTTDSEHLIFQFRIGFVSTGACWLAVDGVKLEKGNKATEWSPTPEDIDTSIATVDGKFANYSTTSQMNSAINQKANEITSTVSQTYATKSALKSTDNKFANYSTTSAMNTAINQKANEITSSVSQTYATKTALKSTNDKFANYSTTSQMNSAIKQKSDSILSTVSNTYTTKADFNNLDIGGRNLAQNTSDSYSKAYTNFNGSENTCPYLAKVLTKGLAVGDTVTVRLEYKYTNIVATGGKSASCWIQGSGNVTKWNSGSFGGSPHKTITGSGGHTFVYRFTVTTEHLKNSYWDVSLRHDYVASGSIQFKSFKVEKGNKATAWTPAPEDIDNKFANYPTTKQMESKITQTAQGINTEVSKKLNSADLSSRIQQSANDIKIGFNKITNFITIDPTNGLKINHEDGSYTRINAGGLSLYQASTGYRYKCLVTTGYFSIKGKGTSVITLPAQFDDVDEWDVDFFFTIETNWGAASSAVDKTCIYEMYANDIFQIGMTKDSNGHWTKKVDYSLIDVCVKAGGSMQVGDRGNMFGFVHWIAFA